MTDDVELLRRYSANRDETAFAEIVRRHLGLVYHAALRQCGGDAHRAEDVAQTVFTDLARKATALARRPVLAGWLHTSTRYAASQAVRGEARRQAREQEAHAMNEILSNSGIGPESAADWERLRPVIDDALHALGERDREAVLLRFFEGRAFAEVGASLFLSEDAARMRVERALEKLRGALVRRGITSTTTALGLVLANQAGVAAPAGLVASVAGAALAGAALGGTAGAWLAIFTMSKLQMGIVAALIAVGLTTAVVEVRANWELRAEIGSLQAGADEIGQLEKENQQLNAALQKLGATNPEADELALLRSRVAQLKARPIGITDTLMKPAAEWRNVGRMTPATALETQLWAASIGDLDELARSYVFSTEMKAGLETFFAGLSTNVRAKYGTPERLLAAIWLTMFRESPGPTAFQVLSKNDGSENVADALTVRVAMRVPYSDVGKVINMDLRRGAAGWGMVAINYSDSDWAKLAARIDPITGEIRAAGK